MAADGSAPDEYGHVGNGYHGTTVARVRELIGNQLNVDVPDPDADLVESGLLDSLGLVILITALEDDFACELPLDDFDVDRFRTVGGIAGFVDDARATHPQGA